MRKIYGLIKGMTQPDYDKMLSGLYNHTVSLISAKELNDLIKKEEVVILDTRSKSEYNVSHIDNAIFINYKGFNINNFEPSYKKKKIILYCSVGYRSEKIGEKLLKAGYENVFNLYGGIFQWVNNGFQVVDKSGEITKRIHAYNRLWGRWLKKGIKVYE